MKKTGTLIESLLVGEGGRSAVLTFSDDVKLEKPFGDGSVPMNGIAVHGSAAHMLDAGMQALHLLQQEEPSRPRVLLFIGQPTDAGSSAKLANLERRAAEGNVTIHCLTLPIIGKSFVAETLTLRGKNEDLGGFVASADLMKLIPALRKAGRRVASDDPCSALANATGGTQLHSRTQEQLENAVIAIGTAIRSSYLLEYTPRNAEQGYHRLSVALDVPGDKVYSRPGYWRVGE